MTNTNPSTGARAYVPVTPTSNVQLPSAPVVLVDVCDALKALQKRRRFCIKSQSRCDRSCESFIAQALGFQRDASESARKAIYASASAIRRAVEKSARGRGHDVVAHKGQIYDASIACTPIILQSASAREGWDTLRASVEKQMRKLAAQLPVHDAFVKGVRGFSALGLAAVVGEAGDLSNYSTVEKLWKRLGLAVIDGQRQRRVPGAEEALKHGYNPARRSEIWTFADSMFKQQWAKATDTEPAQPTGPYGVVYAKRKAATKGRGMLPAHREQDARRVMSKALIEDLWREWKKAHA